ncbi:MAG: sphingomyelin synthase family protein [Bacteroidota bacterium]|nr:sphingomyelin synthase family protein [Bacteroidota bacterium]
MAPILTPTPASDTHAPALPPGQRTWPAAWARRGFRVRLGLVVVLLLGLLPVVPGFYRFVQARPGQRLADPLLALLPVQDHSTLIFTLIYGAIAATLIYLLPRPQRLLQALWAYYLLQLLRMATLWLLPLEPPATLVLLHDPVMDRIFEVTTQPIVRDLFFSGHTATMTLLTLVGRGRGWRWALGLATVAVGLLVLVQRVHYSYDVLAAPFFAGAAYWLAGRICRQ